MSFATQLRTARHATGKSQEACARELDVSLSTWAHWEQGIQSPTLATLARIATLLGVDQRDLL